MVAVIQKNACVSRAVGIWKYHLEVSSGCNICSGSSGCSIKIYIYILLANDITSKPVLMHRSTQIHVLHIHKCLQNICEIFVAYFQSGCKWSEIGATFVVNRPTSASIFVLQYISRHKDVSKRIGDVYELFVKC